ncbi:sensor histidine kinase [Demequina sp. B12]|uniref:sensor histidine kinase n=1 Tax=Demequina sp. B12 TaxID=2992757 RepID=UPI00237BD92E|nr:sensor histidine kinase [Demequina sp. B12]MDE0572210.1 sensor histidine kinase [Demequina sp. B12]
MDTTLRPVAATLRIGLHGIVAALCGVVIARAWISTPHVPWPAILGVALVAAIYAGGGWALRRGWVTQWAIVLALAWLAVLAVSVDAAYLAFPFALLLGALGGWARLAIGATVLTTGSVAALSYELGWSVPGVVGPLTGIAVGVGVGLGYRTLVNAIAERDDLVDDLKAARDETQRHAHALGVMSERARLSRELHDTVSQSLSSIQMLIHAARQAANEGDRDRYLDTAQAAAAESVKETRRIIAALAPEDLEDGTLRSALERVAHRLATSTGADVAVTVSDQVQLPVEGEATLLRIAQSASANIEQHAQASHVWIEVVADGGAAVLTVADDGIGFDTGSVRSVGRQSFGLTAMRERVEVSGGSLTVSSAPGQGSTVVARVEYGS